MGHSSKSLRMFATVQHVLVKRRIASSRPQTGAKSVRQRVEYLLGLARIGAAPMPRSLARDLGPAGQARELTRPRWLGFP